MIFTQMHTVTDRSYFSKIEITDDGNENDDLLEKKKFSVHSIYMYVQLRTGDIVKRMTFMCDILTALLVYALRTLVFTEH